MKVIYKENEKYEIAEWYFKDYTTKDILIFNVDEVSKKLLQNLNLTLDTDKGHYYINSKGEIHFTTELFPELDVWELNNESVSHIAYLLDNTSILDATIEVGFESIDELRNVYLSDYQSIKITKSSNITVLTNTGEIVQIN